MREAAGEPDEIVSAPGQWTLLVTGTRMPGSARPAAVPGRVPVAPVRRPLPAPAGRYLRTLSEAVAAEAVAAVAARDDIVRVADRQGVTVVVAAQAVLEDTGTWPAVSRFRLLNYLKAGLVDVRAAAGHGRQAEPLRPDGQDLLPPKGTGKHMKQSKLVGFRERLQRTGEES